MCSSTPYRWPIYSNDSIMEFSNRVFSFMETSFHEIFCQGFFFHGKFFSWNFPFHEIKIFPGIFLIMENSFHGICFHSIFFLKFSFMEKKSWKIPAAELQILEIAIFRKIAKNWKHCNSWNQLVFPYLLL